MWGPSSVHPRSDLRCVSGHEVQRTWSRTSGDSLGRLVSRVPGSSSNPLSVSLSWFFLLPSPSNARSTHVGRGWLKVQRTRPRPQKFSQVPVGGWDCQVCSPWPSKIWESLPILADSSEVCEEFLGVWIIPLPFPSCHSVTLVLSSLHVSLHLSPCHVLPIVQGFLPSAWLLKVPHLLLVSIRCGETGTLSFPSSISWLHLSVYFYIISFSFYLAIDGHLYCFCI